MTSVYAFQQSYNGDYSSSLMYGFSAMEKFVPLFGEEIIGRTEETPLGLIVQHLHHRQDGIVYTVLR